MCAAAVDRVGRVADRLEHARLSPAVAAQAKREVGKSSIVVVPLDVRGSQDELSDLAVDMREEVGAAEPARATACRPTSSASRRCGPACRTSARRTSSRPRRPGFPIVLLILLAVFGSLAAAALPLALGFASVSITGAGIFFLSQATDMSVFVTNVASMIGIGVAVDYSLFILARYREEMRAGREPQQARAIAMRTSGLAVAFSGVTVMVSLAGLFLVDSTTIRSMAMGAIIVVAVSILAAVTLLPVLIRLLGTRAYARGRIATVTGLLFRSLRWRRRRPGSTREVKPDFWTRWTDRVTRRPGAGGGHQRRGPPRAGHPGAFARVRRRRPAPVPQGQRDPGGGRAGRQGAGPGLRRPHAGDRRARRGARRERRSSARTARSPG